MVPIKDVTGRPSRLMDLAQQLGLLAVIEANLIMFKDHIPVDYAWAYPIIHLAIGLRIAWLRMNTTTVMK